MIIDESFLQWATPREREVIQAINSTGGYRKAAKKLGIGQGRVSDAVKRTRKRAAAAGYSPDHDMTRTVPEGFHVKGVSTYYNKDGNPAGQWVKSTKDRTEVIHDSLKEAIEGLQAWKPPKIQYDSSAGEVCAVLSIFDHHFGKLAWRGETNSDYDLKIAAELFMKAGMQLINKVKGFEIEKFVFPLGSDFLHIDNAQNTTTGGTQQDVDSRLPKIYAVAKQCVIQLIMECIKVAPVDVVYVPGNHDYNVAWYITDTIDSWFRETPQVKVCTASRARKYIDYGVNLIGLAHGDKVKPDRLALLIMDENKENLAGKEYLEWLTGHYHKKAEKQFHAGESFGSVVVKSIPSLCGTDAWHYLHGFVNSRRAAEIHLYDKKRGPAGYFPVHIGNISRT